MGTFLTEAVVAVEGADGVGGRAAAGHEQPVGVAARFEEAPQPGGEVGQVVEATAYLGDDHSLALQLLGEDGDGVGASGLRDSFPEHGV